jgi:hypothetical protein
MPKFDFSVSIVLSGPPSLNAALIFDPPTPGISTQRSRGKDTASVR